MRIRRRINDAIPNEGEMMMVKHATGSSSLGDNLHGGSELNDNYVE